MGKDIKLHFERELRRIQTNDIARVRNQEVIEMTKNIRKSRDMFSKYFKLNRRFGKIFHKVTKNTMLKVNVKNEQTPNDELKKTHHMHNQIEEFLTKIGT